MRSCYSYQCFHLCNRKVYDSNLVSRGRSENLKLTGLAKVSLESKNGGALRFWWECFITAKPTLSVVSKSEATPTTQRNPDTQTGWPSNPFPQVEFAGATYCPQLTANPSTS